MGQWSIEVFTRTTLYAIVKSRLYGSFKVAMGNLKFTNLASSPKNYLVVVENKIQEVDPIQALLVATLPNLRLLTSNLKHSHNVHSCTLTIFVLAKAHMLHRDILRYGHVNAANMMLYEKWSLFIFNMLQRNRAREAELHVSIRKQKRENWNGNGWACYTI